MPKITFETTGQIAEVAAGSRVLDYCEAHPTPVAFGCRQGRCGTCAVEILDGADRLNPRSQNELNTLEGRDNLENLRLCCQLEINGDITIRQPR